MHFRSSLYVFAGTLLLALGLSAIPGSSVNSPGAGTTLCAQPQVPFSIQDCGTANATYASVSDEFNNPAESAAAWTVVAQRGSLTESAAFEPYTFATGTNRYTWGGWRDGWFFAQPLPSILGGVREWVGIYRDYSPTNEATIYVQFAYHGSAADIELVRVALATSSTTGPNAIVGAGCQYTLSTSTLSAWQDAGSSGTQNIDVQPVYTAIVLHRLGNQYWCWGGSDEGHMTYVGTQTKAFTPTRLWLAFSTGNTTTGNGAVIFGANFIRVIENARVVP